MSFSHDSFKRMFKQNFDIYQISVRETKHKKAAT